MIQYFDLVIKPASERLQAELDKVNDFRNYKDSQGITHVTIMDDGVEWKLINGAWVAQPPF